MAAEGGGLSIFIAPTRTAESDGEKSLSDSLVLLLKTARASKNAREILIEPAGGGVNTPTNRVLASAGVLAPGLGASNFVKVCVGHVRLQHGYSRAAATSFLDFPSCDTIRGDSANQKIAPKKKEQRGWQVVDPTLR